MPPVPPKEDVDAMHKSHAFRYEEQSRAQRCIKAIKDTYGPYYAKVEIEHMQVPLSNMFVLPLPAYDRLPAKDDMDLKCFLGSGLAIGAGKRSDLNTLGIFTAAELIALSRHELELLLKATTNFGQASLSRLVAHCAGKGLPLRDE
jgi:predicted flap endonuclease-1-like 5' DNA nuclease